MLRRKFLQVLAGTLLGSLMGLSSRTRAAVYTFAHGVASGDPLTDGVVLWTRISGASGETVDVDWQVASDAAMRSVIAAGRFSTRRDRDYTVKVDVRGLPTSSRLFYRFSVGDVRSSVGTTRTLPVGAIDRARFAVVSCSNYPAGFFHVYREISLRDDLDAIIHLGDYLYEYGQGEYATQMAEQLGRVPDPPTEILSLSDYRRRHAQYKADPDSLAMHAAHPLIPIWDDHEFANDAWKNGAENHNDKAGVDEGSWARRKAAALQAYFEWMPIRAEFDRTTPRIFRTFDYGDLLSLIMLDTRLYGRDRQPDISGTDGSQAAVEAVLNTGKRQLLGRRQQRWLRKRLKAATTWQVIGQQVLVSRFNTPDLEPVLDLEKPAMMPPDSLRGLIAQSKTNPPVLLDTWDGYPWARQQLLKDVDRFGKNTVILSGDLHTPIAGDVFLDSKREAVAVEFMPSSVTSPGFADYLPEREPGGLKDATLRQNPALRYMETGKRGWLCMTFTRQECVGEWHHVDSVTTPTYTSTLDRRLAVRAGQVGAGLRDA